MRRLDRSRLSPAGWGLIGLAAVSLVLIVVFVGTNPFAGAPYELRAAFQSDAELGIRSPVRIAGVDVGEVTGLEPAGEGSDKAIAVMELDQDALPVHLDATAKIRPRLLLEGNFYIELNPGSSASPELDSGSTIAADHTSGPVQLDRVLSDLPADARTSLRTVVQGLGETLNERNSESVAQSLNDSAEYSPKAFEGLVRTNAGLRGRKQHDLSKLVENSSRVLGTFASREAELSEMISGLDRTMAAVASRQAELRRSIELLPPVVGHARSALRSVNSALPATRTFADRLTPSIERLPGAIDAAGPWIPQANRLLSRKELGGLARDLQPAVGNTAKVVHEARPVLNQLDLIDRCLIDVLLPNGEVVIDEPSLSTGATVNEEFFQAFVGIASSAQNFDGNGRYIRGQSGGGAFPVQTSPLPEQGVAYANAALEPIGTRPAYPGQAPPFNTDVACADSDPPDLNSAQTGPAP